MEVQEFGFDAVNLGRSAEGGSIGALSYRKGAKSRVFRYAVRIETLAEAFGIDVEVHACGPAHRHVMAATRNSNYYEVALVGPDCPNVVPPVYACGYSDQLDCVGPDGCVPVPTGPGLGVTYDWAFIEKNRTRCEVFEAK